MRGLRRLGLLLLAAGAGVMLWRGLAEAPGPTYQGRIDRPLFAADGPTVLIDDAHWNAGTGSGRLRALTGLLVADGYVVLPPGNATRAEMLTDVRIAVLVNPLGVLGVARRAADRVGLSALPFFDDDGLLTQEIETALQWIENGGSMLLAVDEWPLARGSRGLVDRLGVRLHERLVVDLGHSDGPDAAHLVFSRENGLFGQHPIVDGFADAPPVNRVVTFRGQAIEAGPADAVLLRLSPSATDVAQAGDPATTGHPVAGLAQAVALERGRGRVVVLGDSQILTADAVPGGPPTGLAWPATNNERFVRYALRWLSRKDDPAATRRPAPAASVR